MAGSVAQSTGRIQVLIQLRWDLTEDKSPPFSVLRFSSRKGGKDEMATYDLLVKTPPRMLKQTTGPARTTSRSIKLATGLSQTLFCQDVPELCCGQHTRRNFPLLWGSKYIHPHAIGIKNKAGNGTSNDP